MPAPPDRRVRQASRPVKPDGFTAVYKLEREHQQAGRGDGKQGDGEMASTELGGE